MNKIFNKILFCTIAALAATTFNSCKESSIDESQEFADGEGVLALTISRSTSDSSLPEETVLRLYNSSERLIARYESLSEIPEAIYLAAGDYKATVFVAEDVDATTSADELSYYGEKEFTITGGGVSDLTVKCTVRNSVVAVKFDETVLNRFELENIVYLSIAESFDKDAAVSGSVPTLTFTEDGMGYFLLPEGSTTIAWGYYGTSDNYDYTLETSGVELSKTAEASGVITNPQAATIYTLNFAYSPTPDGTTTIAVSINTDEDTFKENNNMFFSPQPTISAVDFELDGADMVYTGGDKVLDIVGFTEIANIYVTSESLTGGSINILESGVDSSCPGATWVVDPENSLEGTLTLSEAFFAQFIGGYGDKEFTIWASDVDGSDTYESTKFLVGGLDEISGDYWSREGELSANIILDGASSVSFSYRTRDDQAWTDIEATAQGDGKYTAAIAPTWTVNSTVNTLGDVSSVDGGYSAASTYQVKITVDGVESAATSYLTGGGQEIPEASMDDSSMLCFLSSDSGKNESTTWASGNNSYSKTLCTQSMKNGYTCAYLATTTAMSVIAAGNIVYGQFNFSSFVGYMRFGQYFDWQARPRALKCRVAATLGTDNIKDSGNRLNGKDRGRIYMAIVDWSDRHTVSASSSGASNTWDPEIQNSTDEGAIIAYASLYIDEDIDTMTEIEIPIYYYDTQTRPTNDITFTASGVASAYGDYLTGSTDSRMWIDNFELVY